MHRAPIVFAAGLITTITATSALAGTWGPGAFNLSGSGDRADATRFDVSTNDAGVFTSVWSDNPMGGSPDPGVKAAQYVDGAWSPPVAVSAAGTFAIEPVVASSGTGDATVALWTDRTAATRFAVAAVNDGTGWGTPQTLSAAGQSASSADVAMDDQGTAVALWLRSDGSRNRAQASIFTAGSWSAPVDLSAAGQNASRMQVAAAGDGTFVAVWRRFDGTDDIVQARVYSGGSWGPVENLSNSGSDSDYPSIASDGDGVVTVAWVNSAADEVQAVRRAGGAWSAPVTISGPDVYDGPYVSANDAGVVAVGWSRDDGSQFYRAEVARYAEGAWGSAATLSAPSNDTYAVRTGVALSGDIIATWSNDTFGSPYVIESAQYTSGAWTASQVISPSGPSVAQYLNALAVAPGGSASANWIQDQIPPTAVRMRSRVYMVPPSLPRDVAATISDTQATVTWAPPISNGGRPITGYTATATSGARSVGASALSCTTTGATTCVITGLTPGSSYSFRVTATNSVGTSGESAAASGDVPAPSTPSTPTTPSAPAAAASGTAAATAATAPTSTTLSPVVLPSRTRLRSGQTLRVGIRARNTGSVTASSTTSCLRLPSNFSIVRRNGALRSGRTLCFRVGDIAAGRSVTKVVTLRAVGTRTVTRRITGTTRSASADPARTTTRSAAIRISPRPARARVTG